MHAGGRAFTLIELLIVVAIIAILAAIAVPNFLEAQTRAKVARVQNDMRVMATALEMYRTDHNSYPPRFGPVSVNYATDDSKQSTLIYAAAATRYKDSSGNPSMILLTTPVSYITSLFSDPFDTAPYRSTTPVPRLIDYVDPPQTARLIRAGRLLSGAPLSTQVNENGYVLSSVGPDGYFGHNIARFLDYPDQSGTLVTQTLNRFYDPSNGTTSFGNIYRFSAYPNNEQVFHRQ
jgi:prepilin-type N-terminal cleavage/methylation domain-containing protein